MVRITIATVKSLAMGGQWGCIRRGQTWQVSIETCRSVRTLPTLMHQGEEEVVGRREEGEGLRQQEAAAEEVQLR